MNGLKLAGVTVNRKMLAEVAIDNPETFTSLVEMANSALNGDVKAPVKKETQEIVEKMAKEESTEEMTDLTKLTVAELKEMAKEKGIKGYSKMTKDEIIKELQD